MLKAFFNKPLKARVLRGFILAFILAAVVTLVPTPFRLMAPGQVERVSEIISIDADTYKSSGEFLLPTVVSEPASLLYCIYSVIEPDAVLTTSEHTEPQAQSPDGRQMALSQYLATTVALEALGHRVRGDFLGLRILSVDPNSPNLGDIRPGDLITHVDGLQLESLRDFKKAIAKKFTGDVLPTQMLREGQETELELNVFERRGYSFIGVQLRPEHERDSLPYNVSFRSGKTIGASGGLVFALEIYDRLTREDLTKGRRIAATGTLDGSGRVGAISGLEFKFKGIQRAGADLILIPRANFNNDLAVPNNVEVIAVDSFNEALYVLKR